MMVCAWVELCCLFCSVLSWDEIRLSAGRFIANVWHVDSLLKVLQSPMTDQRLIIRLRDCYIVSAYYGPRACRMSSYCQSDPRSILTIHGGP